MTFAAIVLAAGASHRFGAPKQLVSVHGRPLVRHVAETALAACDEVCVVVGSRRPRVEDALSGLDVTTVDNPGFGDGMASSIRAGVAWVSERPFDAAMILVGDQHRISVTHLRALCRAFSRGRRRGETIAASRYFGATGVPAIFDASHFSTLSALVGDRGARDIIRADPNAVVVDWNDGALDLDTQGDLAHLRR